MTDDHALLERVLTEADPARTPRDAKPDPAAERTRDRIIRTASKPRPQRRRALGWASGIAMAAAAVVVAVAVLVPQWAAVAGSPAPLDFAAGEGTAETLDTAQATLRATPGPADPERVVRSATWGLDINGSTGATKVVPQLNTLRWEPDLSGRMVSVRGVPYDPTDASANVGAEISSSGEVVVDLPIEPGQFSTPVPDVFGDSREDVSAALMAFGMPSDPTGSEVVAAATSVLEQWTLTNAQESQVLDILADADGVEALGTTADRLGRQAAGLRVITTDGAASDVVLLSLDTGRIIGVERTNLITNDLMAGGTIISYTMWDVDEDLVR
ncbi:hypothetical protein ASF87_16290 [Microbacterium sp. Leaf161]|uniref:hypothetical protein n=1 Tax=Microbacterium sp. Leaf161 TaxID=1736281 RepID=UPI0006F50CB5|nr:hypothetical protein [Microbacterium sp. Leaf161]KQR43357.1 hypothetical protein ASF87_16290 [Microbacterium sp. Leaf161]